MFQAIANPFREKRASLKAAEAANTTHTPEESDKDEESWAITDLTVSETLNPTYFDDMNHLQLEDNNAEEHDNRIAPS